MSGRQFGGCGLKGIGTRGGGSSDGFRKRKGLRGKGKQSALAERCPVPRIPYVVQPQAARAAVPECFFAAFKLGQRKSKFKRQFQRTPTDFRPALKTWVKVRGQKTSSQTRANNQSQQAAARIGVDVPTHGDNKNSPQRLFAS